MASGTTPKKRFAIRTTLVTGTTLATIVGAQTLASLDSVTAAASSAADGMNTTTAEGITETNLSPLPFPTQIVVLSPGGTASAAHAIPNIVILRHSGLPVGTEAASSSAPVQSTSSGAQAASIRPPNPVQIAPLQPAVQQIQPSLPNLAPIVPSTGSSH